MRRTVRCAIAAAVLAAAATAGADDTAQRDAQARFEEGLARVRAGAYDDARVSFEQAAAVMRKPAVIWNLALTEEKTHRPVEALAHFKEYLRLALSTDPDRPRAQKHIDTLNAATAHIDVAAPAGATITLDGTREVGAAPLGDAVDVVPGHHEVVARLPTGVKVASLDLVAGQTARADLSALEAASVTPGATAPQSTGEPPAPPGQPVQPVAEQPAGGAFGPERLITVIAVGGAAVVAAGAGLVLGIESNNEAGAAKALRTQVGSCAGVSSTDCQNLASDVSAQRSDHTASTVMWVLGGVLAAGAVGAFFLWPKGSVQGQAAVRIAPAVGPTSAGLAAVGTF
jgi:hypothetical protein